MPVRALWREMLTLADRRRPFAVCTVVTAEGSVPGKVGATMIVTPDGRTRGTVGGAGLEERVKAAALESLRTGRGGYHQYDLAKWKEGGLNSICGGTVGVSILVHRPVPHLLLFGGGHCGKALADVAHALDWDVTVVDPRPEYANRERFPPAGWTNSADLHAYTHVYVLGHSWETDADILAALLPRRPGFVGVIGSRAKRVNLTEAVRTRGVAPAEMDRVACPVGADIGAESPEEIAVAIAAEVISTLKRSPEPSVEVLP
jgi:xanthine dehydrogenase accessory factor